MNEFGANIIEAGSSRRQRLEKAVGPVVITPIDAVSTAGPLIGITSSRLGHDPSLHRAVCRFLTHSLLQCRQRGGIALVAIGSAIEPWAIRAAELFAVPVQTLSVDAQTGTGGGPHASGYLPLVVQSAGDQPLSRDEVLIALADRVDAVYVRRGGTIERCISSRVRELQDASTRVSVSGAPHCSAPGLIAEGAIGWFCYSQPANRSECGPDTPQPSLQQIDDGWTRTDGQWLVHCTRGCRGRWPGETERQYRDWMLLGDYDSAERGPLESLSRIVASGRLVAATGATRRSQPVVCFSAAPLEELLSNRCFRPHLRRWDYEPYGVAIRIEAAKNIGIRPVIYGDPKDRKALPRCDEFRFHPVGKTFDWQTEREWRAAATVDLAKLRVDDVRVFVRESKDALKLPQRCPWPVTVLSAT